MKENKIKNNFDFADKKTSEAYSDFQRRDAENAENEIRAFYGMYYDSVREDNYSRNYDNDYIEYIFDNYAYAE